MRSILKRIVKAVMFASLALGAIAIAPAARQDGSVLKAATLECHDYKFYVVGGGSVTCYDPTAANCTICHSE